MVTWWLWLNFVALLLLGVPAHASLTVVRRDYPVVIPGAKVSLYDPDIWRQLYGYFGQYSTFQHYYHVSRSDGRKGVVFQDATGVVPSQLEGTSKVYVLWFSADFTSADPPKELQSTAAGETNKVRLSGVTMDDADNIYYMTFVLTPKYETYQKAHIFRVNALTGATKVEPIDTGKLDIRELKGSGAHLHYHKGVITCFYSRIMISGHQGSQIAVLNALTLKLTNRRFGASHSFGHTVFMSSDDDKPLVSVEVSDNPHALRMARHDDDNIWRSSAKAILRYKGFSNNCFMELAHGPGMVETSDGIVVVFASERLPLDYNFLGGWDWGYGKLGEGGFLGYGYNGPKNLGFLKVHKDMKNGSSINNLPREKGHYYSNWLDFVKRRRRPKDCPKNNSMDVTAKNVCHDPLMTMTQWEARSKAKGKLHEFSNPGVLWLTDYGGGPGSFDVSQGAVHRPKVVRPCENKILLIWEVWNWKPSSWNRTEYMIVDDDGSVITMITPIDVRLNPTDDVSVEGKTVISYVGSKDGNLTRYEISGVCDAAGSSSSSVPTADAGAVEFPEESSSAPDQHFSFCSLNLLLVCLCLPLIYCL